MSSSDDTQVMAAQGDAEVPGPTDNTVEGVASQEVPRPQDQANLAAIVEMMRLLSSDMASLKTQVLTLENRVVMPTHLSLATSDESWTDAGQVQGSLLSGPSASQQFVQVTPQQGTSRPESVVTVQVGTGREAIGEPRAPDPWTANDPWGRRRNAEAA